MSVQWKRVSGRVYEKVLVGTGRGDVSGEETRHKRGTLIRDRYKIDKQKKY